MADYTSCSDEELLIRLKAGEHAIMDYIMEKYKYMVRKNAKAFFLIGGDADDLIQEGMIGLFKAVRDFSSDKESSFVSFANLCINRQLYSAVRASNMKKHLPLNTYISLYAEDNDYNLQLIEQVESRETQNPENMLINQEMIQDIYAKLYKKLSKFEQQVLHCYLTDLDYHQIAVKLQKTDKSIDNALQRIRNKMQKMI